MTWNKNVMSNYSLFNENDVHNVALGDDYTIQAEGKGIIKLLVQSEYKIIKLTLYNICMYPICQIIYSPATP